jgi:hypothetical protein
MIGFQGWRTGVFQLRRLWLSPCGCCFGVGFRNQLITAIYQMIIIVTPSFARQLPTLTRHLPQSSEL